MKSTETIKAIAEKTGLTQGNVKSVLDALGDVSLEALNQSKTVSIGGLVTLKAIDVPATSGTSFEKKWTKPAHKRVKATIAKKLKAL